ncbi:MAG: hypothetical protein ACYDH5_19365, partial [Acidimicrobiales bacterium]
RRSTCESQGNFHVSRFSHPEPQPVNFPLSYKGPPITMSGALDSRKPIHLASRWSGSVAAEESGELAGLVLDGFHSGGDRGPQPSR